MRPLLSLLNSPALRQLTISRSQQRVRPAQPQERLAPQALRQHQVRRQAARGRCAPSLSLSLHVVVGSSGKLTRPARAARSRVRPLAPRPAPLVYLQYQHRAPTGRGRRRRRSEAGQEAEDGRRDGGRALRWAGRSACTEGGRSAMHPQSLGLDYRELRGPRGGNCSSPRAQVAAELRAWVAPASRAQLGSARASASSTLPLALLITRTRPWLPSRPRSSSSTLSSMVLRGRDTVLLSFAALVPGPTRRARREVLELLYAHDGGKVEGRSLRVKRKVQKGLESGSSPKQGVAPVDARGSATYVACLTRTRWECSRSEEEE